MLPAEAPMWLLLVGSAFARDKLDVVAITVVDGADHPVPTAFVIESREHEVHRVNSQLGTWEATAIYLVGGQEVRFAAADSLHFQVGAPGYASQDLDVLLTGHKDYVVVHLGAQPAPPAFDCRDALDAELQARLPAALPAGADADAMLALTDAVERQELGPERACLQQTRAWAAYQRWVDLTATYVATPTDEGSEGVRLAAIAARKDVAAWRDWLSSSGGDVAPAARLCGAMPDGCDPLVSR
jgi:hypothetical protein